MSFNQMQISRRWVHIWSISVVLALVVLVTGKAYAEDCAEPFRKVIELPSSGAQTVVARVTAVFEDPAGRMEYEQVLRANRDGRFKWHCRADIDPPESNGALWVRLEIQRAENAPADWVITFGSSQIDEARLYQPQANGLFILKRTGRAVPADTRDMVSRWPAIGLTVEEKISTPIYVRVSGITAPYTSIELVSATRFAEREGIDLLTIAAVLGFMVAMLAYNVVIYVRSRLHQCLYYFLYLGFIVLHVVFYDGLVYRFANIRLTGQFADGLSQLFGVAAAICLLMFGRLLLRLRRSLPQTDTLMLCLVFLMGASIFAEFTGLFPAAIASSILPLVAGTLMSGCAVWFAVRGSRPAIYFSLSFVALLAGVMLDMLGYFYPVALTAEPTLWTYLIGVQQNWSFHIGICAEAVLISFAITYFIRDMQAEVVDARAEADQTREETVAARQEFTEKYTDLAQRVGILDIDAADAASQSADREFLATATRVIGENLADEKFDVAKLADTLAMSERTLRRRVRDASGVSPVEFLRRQRLERGRAYLETGTYQTVAEVARAVGINSPGYFSRIYRNAFDQSPRDALKSD